MKRRIFRPSRRRAESNLVDLILTEIKRELLKDPAMVKEAHAKINAERGRELLTDLLNCESAKSPSPIFH